MDIDREGKVVAWVDFWWLGLSFGGFGDKKGARLVELGGG